MPNLFELPELVSWLQVPEFDTATATLVRDLVTSEIRAHVGSSTYDALTDLSPYKAIALAAAKRAVLNPSGLRSTQIDDYSETFATETLGDVELTEAEQNRIDRILGRAGGAFSIRPAGTPDSTPASRRHTLRLI